MNDVQDLLRQIADDQPCGDDLSFSAVFDEIREARRADDPNLAQGDWQTEIKTANWPRVRALCEDALRTRTKDLQLAAWYTEALVHLQGFDGLARGLAVLDALVTDYWEFCYPAFDPDDLDERAGKIEWLDAALPLAVRAIPVTREDVGAHSWLAWSASRALDNLGLKDPAAREREIAAGKLSGEAFDKAVKTSGAAFYARLAQTSAAARQAVATLEEHVDAAFGHDAPGLKNLRQAVEDCDDLVQRLQRGFGSPTPVTSVNKKVHEMDVKTPAAPALTSVAAAVPVGAVQSRADAVQALREVAAYFRHNEPHSPVALLAERAAKWAEMPLDQWLSSVVKDQGTLAQLQELLDIRPAD